MWRPCLLGMLTVLMAACGGSIDGQPVSAPTTATETQETSEPSDPPARPHELRLNGRDPCALVPESMWPKFFIERPGLARESEAFKSPSCLYSTDRGSLSLTLVVTEGIEAWAEGQRLVQPREVAPIANFPTIALQRPNSDISCSVAVDVAKGQYLLAHVIPSQNESGVPEKCEYAHQLAETAMNTLVA
jgi:hypothetical protein